MQANNPATAKKKPRLPAIEYIRGISMMGVIGIHVGSQYIGNPVSNVHLTALFEIFTRFSVPIFFFISAFGLFYNLDMKNWSYSQFLKKRWKTVLIPYLVWSVFYLLHDSWLYGSGLPSPLYFCGILFFGVAKYQLYFLVLLLWFYLLMPVWVKMVKKLDMLWLIFLLGLQVMFDYWSSFSEPLNLFVYSLPDDSLLKPFFMYRLNYWVMHYIFIFVLGGWLAVHINEFHSFMKKRRTLVTCGFFLSMLALLGYYYYLIDAKGYTQLEAINTAHQLCPAGIAYTICASLFFFTIFTYNNYPEWLKNLLHLLGKHSYFAYLVHPFFIGYLALTLQKSGHLMTAGIALGFYCIVLLLSVTSAAIMRKVGEVLPFINALTIGVYKKTSKK